MAEKIFLASPHMSDAGYEQAFVQEAFDTNWIAPLGSNVTGCEDELVAKMGAGHATALSSGTAAIHMALRAEGEGDVEERFGNKPCLTSDTKMTDVELEKIIGIMKERLLYVCEVC